MLIIFILWMKIILLTLRLIINKKNSTFTLHVLILTRLHTVNINKNVSILFNNCALFYNQHVINAFYI